MLYKKYGNTNIDVSAIGFGGMRFLVGGHNDIEQGAELIKYAYDKGINYFDTAPGYCDDKSELIFGEAFKQMKGDKFYISTKCGLWNAKDAKTTRVMIDRSLKRLNVDKITFYNMWSLKNKSEYDGFMKPNGIYEGILQAHKEGLIEHICFTTHMNSEDIKFVVETELFSGVTLGYNAINFAFRQAGVDTAYKNKLGCVAMNPLGGGIIPNNPKYFSFIKQNEQDSLAVSALKFITSQPQVTVALVGFSNKDEIDESLNATKDLYEVTPSFVEEQSKILRSELDSLCTGCSYCDDCPINIPIPKLMDAYNNYILSGSLKSVNDKLKYHWGISYETAKQCIKCGKCEKACTQKLPIIQRLLEIEKIERL
jgi:predicted aldo/keto reductase-like oxidoreductase